MAPSNHYDLAVAYRICPAMSRMPPPIFADSKYRLAALCLHSFKAAAGDMRIKVWALLDNCPPEYESLFTELWSPEDLVIVRHTGIGNQGTFKQQIRILSQQEDSEFVYFAEDDYFYRPNTFRRMIALLHTGSGNTFITPYHHPDYDAPNLHPQHLRTKHSVQGDDWISELSTTCTFLTSRATLHRAISHLDIYTHRWACPAGDLAMWFCLTKREIFNPFFFLRQLFNRRLFWAWSWLSAWLMGGRMILFRPKFTLLAPSRSFATHMNAMQLDKNVDWQSLWRKYESTHESAFINSCDVGQSNRIVAAPVNNR